MIIVHVHEPSVKSSQYRKDDQLYSIHCVECFSSAKGVVQLSIILACSLPFRDILMHMVTDRINNLDLLAWANY